MIRKLTKQVKVGNIAIGGDAKITIQSMASTKTSDIKTTLSQILCLQNAGCDIIRVAVPDIEAAEAIREIKNRIKIPLVADIHFDYKLALAALEAGADKLRINPGNIGSKDKVQEVANAAKDKGIPIRVGVNAGSIDKTRFPFPTAEALVESGLEEIGVLEACGFKDIVISLKAFDVPTMINAYTLASERCNYPLHLGVTEAGLAYEGSIRSAVGIGALLANGIGDTIRVSLTADPIEEIKTAREILASLDLLTKPFTLVSCPTCGRCEVDIASVAKEVNSRLSNLEIKKPITVAVMGCVVNGPGEAKMADIGIAGGKGSAALFIKGEMIRKIDESEMADVLVDEVIKIAGN